MNSIQRLVEDPAARTLVVSQRLLHRSISRSTIYEFEDLICSLDGADLVAPGVPLRRPAERMRIRARMLLGMGASANWLRRRPFVEPRYELLIVCCEDLSDLLSLGPIDRWLSVAKRSVCYLEELWKADLAARRVELAVLGQFDRVFVSCAGAVEELRSITGTPCDYLPLSVDALQFAPGDPAPERVIDVYAMGRRPEPVHRALQAFAEEEGLFYLYDTFTGNRAIDPADHRRLLASLVKRTRYFLAYRAKVDEPELTARQEEVGARHYEGAAGGAVLVGQPLAVPTFEQAFGYPDAVVAVGETPDSIRETLRELDADPERVARIRSANVENCLLRHDWAHRWQQVLGALAMEPRPALTRRLAALAQAARRVETVRPS